MRSTRARSSETLPKLTTDNAQGELYLPQVFDLLRAAGGALAAYPVDDARLVLGVNDRVALAQVRRLAQQAINERHMRAGVSIIDPSATVIDVRRADRSRHRDRAVHDDQGEHEDRRGLHRQALLPRGLHARGRRERRALRLSAPGLGPAQGRQGGDVRGGQELRPRRRRESPASLLHRRCGRGRAHEPGGGNDHRQLRRPRKAPHEDRQRRARGRGYLVRGPGGRGRRRVHRGGVGRDQGRARRRPRGGEGQAEEHRGVRRAAGATAAGATQERRLHSEEA